MFACMENETFDLVERPSPHHVFHINSHNEQYPVERQIMIALQRFGVEIAFLGRSFQITKLLRCIRVEDVDFEDDLQDNVRVVSVPCPRCHCQNGV
jgi:hypothetical protein